MFGLSLKSLIYYRRQYFWIFAGLTLAAAILIGALSVGSSVRKSLQEIALKRLGDTELVIDARLNPASISLVTKLQKSLIAAPLLFMPGSVSKEDERANGISIYGVDKEFKKFFVDAPDSIKEDNAFISHNLAIKLKVQTGQEIVIRISNNSLLPGDLPLTGSSEDQTAIRLKVTVLEQNSSCGSFSLHPSQLPAENIFVNLAHLQENANLLKLINLVLIKGSNEEDALKVLDQEWLPTDSGLVLKKVDSNSSLELVSNRVFLPEAIIKNSGGTPTLTYMANEISFNKKTVPYSLVSALTHSPDVGNVFKVIPSLKNDEVILNSWTAEDLGAKIGDTISFKYYVDSLGGKLKEEISSFKVKGIIKPEMLDRDLMPAFPGISDEEHCRDWEPGIPMDMAKIRDKDEEYWDDYKGTPKAVISYAKGKEIWGNRYGQTTSLRWPIKTGEATILNTIKKTGPRASGLYLRNIKKEANSAASNGIDFGLLFASMSFFIISAALILTALLHAFHLEKRRGEMGIMLATGYTGKEVKRRFLKEGLLLSTLALVPGIPLGVFYTSNVLDLLSSIWIDAVGTTDIHLHISARTLGAGSITFILFAALTMGLVIRKFLKQSPVNLIQQENTLQPYSPPKYKIALIGAILFMLAIICIFVLTASQFVYTSSLLLISTLCLSHGLLEKLRSGNSKPLNSLTAFSVRNLSRQNARSLGAILLMTCGTYIVLFVTSQQKTLNFSEADKTSGTGGFETMAQTSIPLRYKPDSQEAVKEFGLEQGEIDKAEITSIRYHRGDDASCLNLNKAQAPQVYGISPIDFKGRFSLKGDKWSALSKELPDNVIPVIGDENTVMWGLQLYTGVGSLMKLRDEKGREFTVQIVAMIKSSMLQGAIIMDRKYFDRLYPAESGYSIFLIDNTDKGNEALLENFKGTFEDYGMSLESTRERLRNFLKIESTYLIIFQMLAGLGLILGAFGFGFLILRNVQDRQGEIATMKAIGFNDKDIFTALLKEHLILLFWAVTAGSLCAFVSWLPLIVTNGDLPLVLILTILMLIIAVGSLSCFLSARVSLKSGFFQILKNE
jgi:putative ABC transport system permease protein